MEKHLANRREQSILNEEKKERLLASIEAKSFKVIQRNRDKSELIRKKNQDSLLKVKERESHHSLQMS